MQDNNYLCFVGIAYLSIAALDLLHTLTFKGMSIIPDTTYYANQFWVATRLLEAVTFVAGFGFARRIKLNTDLIFLSYFTVTVIITCSILVWHIFPVCYIEGIGQTPFKVFAEYTIIAVLLVAGYLLIKNRQHFSKSVYQFLLFSLIFTILSEFCFTLYVSNYSTANALGHYAKLIAFFLIYKANVETGFVEPTGLIFKNLADKEEKYRTLTENLPGMVMRFDSKLNCIYTNSEATESGLIIEQLHEVLLQTKLTLQVTVTTMQLQRDGKDYHYIVQVIGENRTNKDEQTYLVICQDITNLKEAEQQLQELNATKDKLFSIIAHDLKNPFTSLISYSEIIYKSNTKLSSEKIGQIALRMNESAKQAYNLLENLLNWSRIQTGILKANPQPVSVQHLLDKAQQFATPLAQAKNIHVIVEKEPDLTLNTDEQMISTVLRNLVGNAIKFSHPESNIILRTLHKSNELIISVTDFGVGIDQEVQKSLLFIGSTQTTAGTSSEKGTGLGLVLCKEFVEINGGRLWLESEPGIGTTSYFTLPLSGQPILVS